MAGELVSFGVQKLWDLLTKEYKQLQGIEDQVAELKSDINLLSSFLQDAYLKKHTVVVVRNCVKEIKEIIFDAEDIIETFLLKDELSKKSGIKKRIRRLACIIPNRREIASDIGGISKRISKVIKDMQSFGVQQIIANDRNMQPLHDRQREMRQTFSRDNESGFVGLEENVKKLVGYLVDEDNVQVVSITGMGGVGKTTLARQVFNHEMVKHNFDGLSWVCVSLDFTRKSVWQTILRSLKPSEEENKILEMTESTLQGELFQLLETSKSLVVLDDIWKQEDWNIIKPIFPPKKDWKVLLTSRNESVVALGDTTYNFKPECLTIEDSWTLFKKIAFPRKDAPKFKVDTEMEKMGKQMIKHCGGLPLAVKVLGDLLAAKYTLHDWKRVYEDIGSYIVGRTNFNEDNNNSLVYHVLSLSFEELPSYLKHCFLYMAHFPEYYAITVWKLSYQWAAEGILRHGYYDGATIRDVTNSYIEDLVRRNMVISERHITTSRFETCHLHDMMREVSLLKAKEENFLQIAGRCFSTTDSQSLGGSRRIVLQNPTELLVERDITYPKLRSLLAMWYVEERKWMLSGLSFTKLQLLRLLDLSGAEFEEMKLPSSIGKLIHLRYLSLEKAKLSHLPSSLRNLKLLIYLNLEVTFGVPLYIPNVLMEMQELRYLELPRRMHKNTKLELSKIVNLESLKNFSTAECSVGDLHGMARLRNLTISLTDETSIGTISASIGGLIHLENLHITDDCRSKRMIEERIVLDFIHLKVLVLSTYMPRILSEKHLPSRLTCLDLRHCCLEEDPMPILEKLLLLKEVSLGSRSFCGRRMVCSGGGFPLLHKLLFFVLYEWEEWIVEEGSMPLLQTLKIHRCAMLKELPEGLRFIKSLKDLTMGEEWKERLLEGGEDYYKVQHIPSVVFQRY